MQLTAADLDECNGITSATPEFPEGVHHYVLLDVADSTSSIRCFSGVVDASLSSMAGMPGMPGMGGGPPPALDDMSCAHGRLTWDRRYGTDVSAAGPLRWRAG